MLPTWEGMMEGLKEVRDGWKNREKKTMRESGRVGCTEKIDG